MWLGRGGVGSERVALHSKPLVLFDFVLVFLLFFNILSFFFVRLALS